MICRFLLQDFLCLVFVSFYFIRTTFCLPFYFFRSGIIFLSNKFDCSLKHFTIGPRPTRSLTPMHIQTIGLYKIVRRRETADSSGKFVSEL